LFDLPESLGAALGAVAADAVFSRGVSAFTRVPPSAALPASGRRFGRP